MSSLSGSLGFRSGTDHHPHFLAGIPLILLISREGSVNLSGAV